MKLSELVRYRNTLDEITPKDVEINIRSEIDPVVHAVEINQFQVPNLIHRLTDDRAKIMSSVENFKETLSTIKHEVDLAIQAMESTYLANSYQLYQEMQSDTTEYILNRRLTLGESSYNYLQSRIQMYSNWQYPGAVIRPGLEPWIEHLVACDPLYVIDTDYDLFEFSKKKFTEGYLNRLRFYTIRENDDSGILDSLPDGQFGFFLIYNFFHYKPFDIFKKYLTEIYAKLSPGGSLAFTFNDCDRWGAVSLTENWFMCYTPGRMVRGLCESLGYEVVNFYLIDNATTWLEIRKPGRRISLKGGQTLAKIIEKSK